MVEYMQGSNCGSTWQGVCGAVNWLMLYPMQAKHHCASLHDRLSDAGSSMGGRCRQQSSLLKGVPPLDFADGLLPACSADEPTLNGANECHCHNHPKGVSI